jgi:hypothetical protein
MLLNPVSDRHSFGIDEAEEVAKNWWIFLLSGLVSLVFGALILAVDWGVDSLAAFVGVLFIIEGVAWGVTRPLDGGNRTTNLIAGGLAIAAARCSSGRGRASTRSRSSSGSSWSSAASSTSSAPS